MTIDRKALKEAARAHVRRHYLLLAALCAVSIFFGAEFTGVVSNAQTWYDILSGQPIALEDGGIYPIHIGNRQVLGEMLNGNLEGVREAATARLEAMRAQDDANSPLGHQRGMLAATVNSINSGRLFAMAGAALNTVIRSQQAAGILLVTLTAALYALVWVFLRNFYRAVLRRAYLETRTYSAFPLSHLLHFNHVRRWPRASLTLLLQEVFQSLWLLTVVGGVIKYFSYFLVPFIVAENPDMRPRDAITLSRRMMDGHKWECCKLELSFLGWHLLGFVTFGAAEALWVVPYAMATYSEFYDAVRREAKAKGLEGAELLNDDCLFAPADEATLKRHYADVTRVECVLDEDIVDLPPVKRFFAVNFGIWLGSMDEKKVFSRQMGLRQQTRVARMEMNGEAYPERVNPLWDREIAAFTGRVSYLAPCTVWSLIMTFFIFCLVGWLWEVSLGLITTGAFVNRGMLHGPWLPIYGSGVVMIATLLYRFRKKPALEAVLVVLLCGFVEYMTSYVTELSTGMRWWDYTGYFLNLNGRICGEGLAVFAVGGMAAVYFLVPLIDAAVTRVKPKIIIPVCLLLLTLFLSDVVYSHFVPNVGPGITDIGGE